MKLGWEAQGKDRLGSLALGFAQAGSAPAEAGCDVQPGSLSLPWALGESWAPEGLQREGGEIPAWRALEGHVPS